MRLLLLFLFLTGLVVWVVGRVRRRLGDAFPRRQGRLTGQELERLRRLGRRSVEIKQALDIRSQVREVLAGRDDPAKIAERVDEALRRLGQQLQLRRRIERALASPTTDLGLDDGTPDRLEEREEILERLQFRIETLEADCEHTIRELSNLHLALLDLTATEAVLDRGVLGEALDELETAGYSARAQAEAEDEMLRIMSRKNRMLPPGPEEP